MNRPFIVLAIVALLSACVAEEDPNTTPPANQRSSVSLAADNSSVSDVNVSSAESGGQSSSANSSASVEETSSASSESESSESVSSVSSRTSSSASSLSQSSRSSAVQEGSSSLSSSQSSSSSSSQSSSEPAVSLVARDLHYSVDLGGSLSVDADDGVMSNDDIVAGAYVEVASAPEQGNLTLNADGSFVYTSTGAAGVDYFHYRLTDGDNSDTAEVSISIHHTVSGSNGFTPIAPSDDSRIIYVSDSSGDDSNDCLSDASPCQTIVAGRSKMRAGYPDHLYLKRGDVWRDQVLDRVPSGRSTSEPAVVAFYGDSGPRPKLENSGASFIGRGDVRYIHIIGLEFSAYRMDPSHPEFTGDDGANIVMTGNHRDFLFEDNKFTYTEVVSHRFTDREGQTFTPRNMTFRRNIWNGYYFNESSFQRNKRPSNIYAGVWDNFSLIENVFDHGGWHRTVPGAGANMYNHNIYLQEGVATKTLIKGNIVTRGSSHGIQMRSGGLAEDNFFARNAVGLSIGYKDPLLETGSQAHVTNNVVSEGHSMVKGVNPCQNNDTANLCSRAVWGIDMDIRGGDADWMAQDNIVSRLAPDDNQWRNMWDDAYQLTTVAINRYTEEQILAGENIIWRWSLDPEDVEHSYPDPDRTLADYNAYLGGQRSFDAFMNVALNRPLQTWDERYTAYAINDYIREGFGR